MHNLLLLFKKNESPCALGMEGLWSVRSGIALVLATLVLSMSGVKASVTVTPVNDTIVDPEALLLSATAAYGRAINGASFQTEAILTYANYQYATWYHKGSVDEDVYLARRDLYGGDWEIMDTGFNLTRTDWDGHNVICIGISGDGVIHLSWDQHCQDLKYASSGVGAATGSTWNASIFGAERSSLNPGGDTIGAFTYPRFIRDDTTGNLFLVFRSGCSGGGDLKFATYYVSTGLWNNPRTAINGTIGDVYTDAIGSSSTRNAYLNGLDVDETGRIHISWTWRESAGGVNHDILYAYSDNGGGSWRNTNGRYLGSLIRLISPEIFIDDGDSSNGYLGELDRRNAIMNQQCQTVDLDNRMHVVMWHADDAHRNASSGFNPGDSDYFHYFRDPDTGVWTRTELPNDREVGMRPDIACDVDGNIFVAYVTPGIGDSGGYNTDGDLVIAYASKAANYTDWTDVYTDTRDFYGEPLIDQKRLLEDGILSIFLQEHDDTAPGITGTPLHILDFSITPDLKWIGDDLGAWEVGTGTDWDTNGDQAGDVSFQNGDAVFFGDDASVFTVSISETVAPEITQFVNNANSYTFTGAGLGGFGDLRVSGGGTTTFDNGPNLYTGKTHIENGTLSLAGTSALSGTPNIEINAEGTLDVTAVSGGVYALDNQTLMIDGEVVGNIAATNNSVVHIQSMNSVSGTLSIQSGSHVEGVGGITGDLIAQSGGTIRVAPGCATSLVEVYEDGFEGNGNPLHGQEPDTTTDGATWVAHTDIPDDGQDVSIASGSSATLPLSLASGFMYTLDVSLRNVTGDSDWFAIGFLESTMTGSTGNGNRFISDPTTGKAWMLFRGDNSSGANQILLGNGDSGTAFSSDWSTLNTNGGDMDLRIVLDTTGGAGNYTAAFYARLPQDADYSAVAGPYDLLNEDIGAVGVAVAHSDVTGDLTYFHLKAENPNPTPRELTVNGGCSFLAGAVLEMHLFSPVDHDKMLVSQSINTGGTLSLVLETSAPDPQPGDVFDILHASSITGVFDEVLIEPLDPGYVWDLRGLYTAGQISVLDAREELAHCIGCLSGPGGSIVTECDQHDHDQDGDVDLFDYAIEEACLLSKHGQVMPGCINK